MMRPLLLSLFLVAGLGACGDDKKPPAAPTTGPEPAAATPVDPDPGAVAPADPAPTPPAEGPGDPAENDACFEQCVQRNQMRAVSAEQIDRDCVAECND
ncbi:MAG TPA: hypothetical protein VML75_03420 [Kofleriaceae bacterium]|nr:hypothetical protein [Kofleriaceae bacterium]